MDELTRLLKIIRSHIESGQDPYVKHPITSTGQAQGVYGIKPYTAQEMSNRRKLRGENDVTDDIILSTKDRGTLEELVRSNPALQERIANEIGGVISNKTKDLDVANYMWEKGHNMTEDSARRALEANDFTTKLANKKLEHNIDLSKPYDVDALNYEPVKVYPRSEPSRFYKTKKSMGLPAEPSKPVETKPFKLGQEEITKEDETTYASNPRNAVVELLGLPESLKMTKADDKRYWANLPEQMGTSSIGSVKNIADDKTAVTAVSDIVKKFMDETPAPPPRKVEYLQPKEGAWSDKVDFSDQKSIDRGLELLAQARDKMGLTPPKLPMGPKGEIVGDKLVLPDSVIKRLEASFKKLINE
jgi:hypothetical protein